jgi:hypothetical protein
MAHNFSGRAPAYRRVTVLCVVAFPFLLSVLPGCREQIPSGPAGETETLTFTLPLGGYYTYDNWKLYANGSRIPTSLFRTSWKVVDTGTVYIGYADVTVVVESTFAKDIHGIDSLGRLEQRFFRTSRNGEVFEFGFVARLLEQRDTVLISPRWDKLFAPQAGANVPWIVETNDSATIGVIYGTLLPGLETVETSINGVPSGVLAYHVEITGRNLVIDIWVSDSPSAILRVWDQSDVLYNRVFQELRVLHTNR